MHNAELESSLIDIAAEVLKKSRTGGVNWQTVGGEPANYYVHFGQGTSFIVCYLSSDETGTVATIALKIGSVIAARIKAHAGEENFASFKELFDEAHRAATGWDDAITMIRKQLAAGTPLGDPAGDIPL